MAPAARAPTGDLEAERDTPTISLAAAFVTGKVSNLRVTLLRTARRRDDLEAAEAADRLEGTLDALDQGP